MHEKFLFPRLVWALHKLFGPFLTLDMMDAVKIAEYQACRLSTQSQDLILPDLGALGRVGYDLVYLFFRQAKVMNKRKEPMHPTRFWFFFQLVSDLLRRFLFPLRQRPGTVDIFPINIQIRIIRIEGCHKVITAHGSLTDKIYIGCVDLINIQASVLTTKSLLPLLLVPISHDIYNLITLGRVKQNMRDLIVLSTIAVILSQYTKIINNTQILVNDVLLCGTCILGSYDVQLFGRLCYLKHKFKQAYRCLSGGCSAFQKLHRGITAEESLVFFGQ